MSGSRVAFYDPYLDMLGGGEKYLLTIAEEVARSGRHRVQIVSPSRPDPARWRRLNIDIDHGAFTWGRGNQLSATPRSARLDLFVALANHFPPLSLARRSALIVQFPFSGLDDSKAPFQRVRRRERALRLRTYQTTVCYSDFVATAVKQRLGVPAPVVIPPPVDLPHEPSTHAKEQMVIAVGRFFPARSANNKRHDVLIEAWRRFELHPAARGWTLHLAGGVAGDADSSAYVAELQRRATGLAITFHLNASHEELRDLYSRSAIFWHATGYGETRPERLEHFGITTVEAMAHGCVPVVLGQGGQLEIVKDSRNGRLWQTVEELTSITDALIGSPRQRQELAAAARLSAQRFSRQEFVRQVAEMIFAPAGIEL